MLKKPKLNQEIKWQKSEPYYDESGNYRAFPGLKPKSTCAGLDESECNHKGDCTFIKDSLGRNYCRGHAGSALETAGPKINQNIESKRFSYVPRTKDTKTNTCPLQRTPESCESNPSCTWIEDSLGRHYCKSHALKKQDEITHDITPSPRKTSKETSGRNEMSRSKTQDLRSSRQFTSQEKESMYSGLDEADTKMCRCLLEVTWDDLRKNGQVTKNPYGICNFTIARSRASSESSDADLRSKLAQTTTSGGCTKFAHFDNFPTEFLYSFAKMRESTSKGKQSFTKIPDFESFSNSPDSYRSQLLQQAKHYQKYA